MMQSIHKSDEQWETFNRNKAKANFPRWPNEVMVKLTFGSYLKNRISLDEHSNVLDVGCGFGNNLMPFLERGCNCFGTEVTRDMAAQTQSIISTRGFSADIRYGKNNALPFQESFFDLVLSINVLHYEGAEDAVGAALAEYKRVLRDSGRLVLITVGPSHTIIERSAVRGPHIYEIQNYDFRDGVLFYCFNSLKYMEHVLGGFFTEVETGRVTESLMTLNLDFFVAACKVKK